LHAILTPRIETPIMACNAVLSCGIRCAIHIARHDYTSKTGSELNDRLALA